MVSTNLTSIVVAIATLAMPMASIADQRSDDMRRLNLDPQIAAKLPPSCVYKVRTYRFFNSDAPCMKLFPTRRLRGVWVVGMENSSFYPGLNTPPTKQQSDNLDVWLDAEDSTDPRIRKIIADGYGIYVIDMLAHMPSVGGAFGHFGMFKRGALLERVLSIKPLRRGAPPLQPAAARSGRRTASGR